MRSVDVVVIGAGQAGLAAAYFLAQRGVPPGDGFVVLDANDAPGGAWQHRWESLRLGEVHGVHPLPGTTVGPRGEDGAARDLVARYFADYERRFELPIVRPVAVHEVRDEVDTARDEADTARDQVDGRTRLVATEGRGMVHTGPHGDVTGDPHGRRFVIDTSRGTWAARGLINATGTWTRPFWPTYPGMGSFAGRQLHTVDYVDAAEFAGQHVVIVGGGHSAVQHLADISEVTSTTWVTRRPPTWREGPFDERAGREAVALVDAAVREGRRPGSVVSVTGLAPTPPAEVARRNGALDRLPMFDRITPDGIAWNDGSRQRADVILWATGFRHALDHLAPLELRGPQGGIRMDGTQVASDPRIHLLGYGPSASTVGAARSARVAVRELRRHLGLR